MEIRLTDSDGNSFAVVHSWDAANLAAKAVFKRQNWSDLYYYIEFDDKQEVHGSIDLEPASFHRPHQNNIFTWHLRTFWTNISKVDPARWPIYSLTEEDIQFFKHALNYLP